MNTTIIILLILGVLSGILSGMVGIGGGILIVPALIFLMNYDQQSAQGTSLAVLLLPVGIMAVINYYKQGYININHALIISVGFVFGGYFGSKLAFILPKDVMKAILGLFMLFFAWRFLQPVIVKWIHL